jgi:hypothetical protein
VAIGNQPNQAQLNSQAAALAGQFRSNAQQALALQSYVVGLGNAGLVALGFTSADGTALTNCVNYMATLAQVYQGSATQPTLFNFQNALVTLTGPY